MKSLFQLTIYQVVISGLNKMSVICILYKE